jgi:hypothetical protein
MSADTGTGKKPAVPASPAISTEDAISMFDEMIPSEEVLMRREMERMFLSIDGAMQRGVDAQQIIDGLRKSGLAVARPPSSDCLMPNVIAACRWAITSTVIPSVRCASQGSQRRSAKAKKLAT